MDRGKRVCTGCEGIDVPVPTPDAPDADLIVCEVQVPADTGKGICDVLGDLEDSARLFTDEGLVIRDEFRATREDRDWLLSAQSPEILRAPRRRAPRGRREPWLSETIREWRGPGCSGS